MSSHPGRVGVNWLPGKRVLVVGAGVAGSACVSGLHSQGALVEVTDQRSERADFTEEDALARLSTFDLVVVSPGISPRSPLVHAAHRAGVTVWGETELAWHMDGQKRRWLVVTGTNGKTTTTGMLESILLAAGEKTIACGNIGHPLVTAVQGEATTLAIELSSFQLSRAPSLRPEAGVVLNIAEDHIDWHGSMDAYIAAKAHALSGQVGIVNADDDHCAKLSVRGRRVEFTLNSPRPGQLGIDSGTLVDNVGWENHNHRRAELLSISDITPKGPAGAYDALAAAALARCWGASAEQVAAGLRNFSPGLHRGEVVAELNGVIYRDDSKATNPHAALNSLEAYPSVVWLAGGQLKGAQVEDLVQQVTPRLRAAVLFGHDRYILRDALRRHAPHVPTVIVENRDDGRMNDDPAELMRRVVEAAKGRALLGDVVLLAPAAASLDQFTGYSQRGDLFSAAVREHKERG